MLIKPHHLKNLPAHLAVDIQAKWNKKLQSAAEQEVIALISVGKRRAQQKLNKEICQRKKMVSWAIRTICFGGVPA
ncbi:MAG TPA: hypothetical protein VMV48_12225 [Gallionellaceae bacterium]|nr:hypothetical protein [Gallionellaceae bacterium]